MPFAILFLEGIITFISPCMIPMLPIYVSYFAAGKPDKRRSFINSLGFVLGFTIVFIALGAFAGTIGKLFDDYTVIVNIVTGAAVILLGLNFIGIINIPLLHKAHSINVNTKELRFFSSIVFGVVYSFGWAPCASMHLGTALMMASNRGGALNGVLLLSVYSFGLGVPFILSAVLIDRLKFAFDFIKRNHKAIDIISGSLLIIIGILMATGVMGRFMIHF